MLLAAAGLFGQLQDALNTIWGVQPRPWLRQTRNSINSHRGIQSGALRGFRGIKVKERDDCQDHQQFDAKGWVDLTRSGLALSLLSAIPSYRTQIGPDAGDNYLCSLDWLFRNAVQCPWWPSITAHPPHSVRLPEGERDGCPESVSETSRGSCSPERTTKHD